jgi:hypothetical protein
MNQMSVDELERAAPQSDLFLVFVCKRAVLTPDTTMVGTFRANMPARPFELTDALIEMIVELVHVDRVTVPNDIHGWHSLTTTWSLVGGLQE